MEIQQLRYFLSVYKYGNITKAAEKLHISQQALSKQIRRFEKELGIPLFFRSVHGVEPTRYAQMVAVPAGRIIKTADDTLSALTKMRREETVSVRMGYVKGDFNFHGALPPQVIFEWEEKFPQMTLEISEHNPDELEQMLLQEELDLICTLNGDENPELDKLLIAIEPAYLLISQKNPLAACRQITLDALARQPFLVSRADPVPEKGRLSLESLLGRRPQFRMYSGSFEQGVEHVRANEGILFSGRAYCLSRSLDGLAAFLFPNEKAVFQHYLAYKKGRQWPEAIRYFVRKLQVRPRPSQ